MKVQVCQLKPGLEYRLLMYEGQGPVTYCTMTLERWWASRDQIMVVGRTGPNDDHVSFSITHTLRQIKEIYNPGEGHWHQSISPDLTWDWDLSTYLPWVVRDLIVSERRAGQFHRYNLSRWDCHGDRRTVRKELNRRRMTLRASIMDTERCLEDWDFDGDLIGIDPVTLLSVRSDDSVIVNSGSLSRLESLTDVKVIVGSVNIPASLGHSLMDLAPLQPGDISIRSVDNPGSLKQPGSLADVGGMKVTLIDAELEHTKTKGFEHE